MDVKKAIGQHVGVTFKLGGSMAQIAIENLKDPNIIEPADLTPASSPPTPAEIKAQKKWEIKYD